MADRSFNEALALEPAVVSLFAEVLIGASGAVTSQTGKGMTITYGGSTGVYIATFADKYPTILFAQVTPMHTVVDTHVQMTANSESAGTINFLHKSAGSAAHPASGSSLFFMVVLKNSTVP